MKELRQHPGLSGTQARHQGVGAGEGGAPPNCPLLLFSVVPARKRLTCPKRPTQSVSRDTPVSRNPVSTSPRKCCTRYQYTKFCAHSVLSTTAPSFVVVTSFPTRSAVYQETQQLAPFHSSLIDTHDENQHELCGAFQNGCCNQDRTFY